VAVIVVAAIVASGIGALVRYEVSGAVERRTGGTWPWGTALVNVVGALLLGVLLGSQSSGRIATDLATVAGAGFLGGLTTFSTWMVESIALIERGAVTAALVGNVALMLLAGVAGAALGASLG
jgi:fluoride exporter